MQRFLRDRWYDLGAVIFVAASFAMVVWGHHLSALQTILALNFMALLVHQYEEYALPGGGPLVVNAVQYGERKDYDRFPGNKQSSMLVNLLAWPFYLLPVVFPNLIWLGLAQVYFGFFQLFGHGVYMNLRGKTFYNPGLASVVFLHVPVGAAYIWNVTTHHLVTASDFGLGFVALLVAIILIIVLPVRLGMNRASTYPMTIEEMSRFGMLAKLRAKGLIDAPSKED